MGIYGITPRYCIFGINLPKLPFSIGPIINPHNFLLNFGYPQQYLLIPDNPQQFLLILDNLH